MVTCRLCGKKFKQITSSGHLQRHSITREQYMKTFPEAETTSSATKKAHSTSMKKRVAKGEHFVPFRDIKGFARKVHDKYMTGPVEYTCIRCGRVKEANASLAERRKFCTNKCHAAHIVENPKLYKARNKKISQSTTGIPKKGGYSRCNGGFRSDLGHYVRSGWEADVCRIFKHHKRPYDYEAYTVLLKDGKKNLTWIIDIVDPTHFLSDGLLEIKGWWDDKSKKKKRLLKRQRPDLYNKLKIIGEKEMKQLVLTYRESIPNWETRKKKGDQSGCA